MPRVAGAVAQAGPEITLEGMLDGMGTPWWGATASKQREPHTSDLTPEFGRPLASPASRVRTQRKPHPLTPSRQVVLEAEEQVPRGEQQGGPGGGGGQAVHGYAAQARR